MTAARVRAEMSSSELTGWVTYFKLKNEREKKALEQHRVEQGMNSERTRTFGGRRKRSGN